MIEEKLFTIGKESLSLRVKAKPGARQDAVLGVRGATSLIASGKAITVDGSEGRVSLAPAVLRTETVQSKKVLWPAHSNEGLPAEIETQLSEN